MKGAADKLKLSKPKDNLKTAALQKKRRFSFMKTLEQKKKEKLPRYIPAKELEEHLNSEEMQDLLKKIRELDEYIQKTKYVSVGQY